MHPSRRITLQHAHDVRDAMGRLQTNEEMYVIGSAANLETNTIQSANHTAEICVYTLAHLGRDRRDAIFRAEQDINVEEWYFHKFLFLNNERQRLTLPFKVDRIGWRVKRDHLVNSGGTEFDSVEMAGIGPASGKSSMIRVRA